MQFLNKLERKFGNYAISNLMSILVFGMVLVFFLDSLTNVNPNLAFTLSDILYFDRDQIFAGQIWRVITFLFLPPGDNSLFVFITIYFWWMVGTGLEAQLGSFRFNVYYLTGVIGAMIGGLITGFATNEYLNASLFLAFAAIFPDYELLLFFFLPIKTKYLAIIYTLFLLYDFIITPFWSYRIAILIAFANFILFFGKDFMMKLKFFRKKNQNEINWKDKNNHWWKK